MCLRSSRALLIVAAFACSFPLGAFGAETYVQSIRPFNHALAQLCPAQHLENVNPGTLEMIIEAYLDKLPVRAARRMERAAQPMCVESVAGVSCSNIAYIRAARKLRMTVSLARAACTSGYVCRGTFDCKKPGN